MLSNPIYDIECKYNLVLPTSHIISHIYKMIKCAINIIHVGKSG